MHDGASLKSYDVSAMFAELDCDKKKEQLVAKLLDGGYPSAAAFWSHVEKAKGFRIGKWKFVADPVEVEKILRDDKAFQVREYDRRMRATSGRFYLGMDGDEHVADAALGDIIPSWNRSDGTTKEEPVALERVAAVAEAACRAALQLYGQLSLIAK